MQVCTQRALVLTRWFPRPDETMLAPKLEPSTSLQPRPYCTVKKLFNAKNKLLFSLPVLQQVENGHCVIERRGRGDEAVRGRNAPFFQFHVWLPYSMVTSCVSTRPRTTTFVISICRPVCWSSDRRLVRNSTRCINKMLAFTYDVTEYSAGYRTVDFKLCRRLRFYT